MNWIKNISLVSLSLILTIVISNLFVSIYLDHYKKNRTSIVETEEIKFYRKYENQLNHLRSPALTLQAPHLSSVTDLLFTQLPQKHASKSILISGDSWAEKFANDEESYKELKNFALSNNIKLTLGGVSSYSPTLIGIQSRILREDFNLSFNEAFIIVDNTDIGDELCRYRNFIKADQNGNKFVKKFSSEDRMKSYMNDDILYVNEVLNSSNFSLVKLSLLIFRKLEMFQQKNINCGWGDISKYLYEISKDDIQYFETTLEFMINEIKSNHPNVRINILTIPHRLHVMDEYKISTSVLIEKFLKRKKYSHIKHFDFSERIKALVEMGYSLDDIFIVGDRASHLTSFAHNKLLVSFIIDMIETN